MLKFWGRAGSKPFIPHQQCFWCAHIFDTFLALSQNALDNLIRQASNFESYSWCTCSPSVCTMLGGRISWQMPRPGHERQGEETVQRESERREHESQEIAASLQQGGHANDEMNVYNVLEKAGLATDQGKGPGEAHTAMRNDVKWGNDMSAKDERVKDLSTQIQKEEDVWVRGDAGYGKGSCWRQGGAFMYVGWGGGATMMMGVSPACACTCTHNCFLTLKGQCVI